MAGILSPVMSSIARTTLDAAGVKDRLDRGIDRHRRMLTTVSGTYNTIQIKFALAELLMVRDNPSDWKEALRHYDEVLQYAPYGYVRAAAMVGRAEQAIRASKKKEIEEAIKTCESSRRMLKEMGGETDFYFSKGTLIEAELKYKIWEAKERKEAEKLFDLVIKNKHADEYFRARAMVGKAELIYSFQPKRVKQGLDLCLNSHKLLKTRPNDYFAVKAKVIEEELRIKRRVKNDLSLATRICNDVMKNELSSTDLRFRAQLDLAEISKPEKAKALVKEVLTTEGLDQYLYDRAQGMKKQWEKPSPKKS